MWGLSAAILSAFCMHRWEAQTARHKQRSGNNSRAKSGSEQCHDGSPQGVLAEQLLPGVDLLITSVLIMALQR